MKRKSVIILEKRNSKKRQQSIHDHFRTVKQVTVYEPILQTVDELALQTKNDYQLAQGKVITTPEETLCWHCNKKKAVKIFEMKCYTCEKIMTLFLFIALFFYTL